MIKEMLTQIAEIQQRIYEQILSLPQNEKLQNITEHPKTFTLQFSNIVGKPFSPYYYDFKAQYQLIVDALKQTKIENFESRLNQILEHKKVIVNNQTYLLAPEVINNIKKLVLVQPEQMQDQSNK